MKYTWLEEYATSKKGAYKEYKTEWGVDRYMLRDKMFIMHGGDKDGKEIITLKLEPPEGQFLRGRYGGDIVPGYYMNKDHWNSVYTDGMLLKQRLRLLTQMVSRPDGGTLAHL